MIKPMLAHKVNDKKIDFTVKYPKKLMLSTDKQRLRQILDNLIRNSVDFVPSNDGKITVEVKIKEKNIIFCVHDNGPGIPKEKQDMEKTNKKKKKWKGSKWLKSRNME